MKKRRFRRMARKRNRLTIAVSLILAVLLVPFATLADTWDLKDGDILVSSDEEHGQTVTQNGSTMADDNPVITTLDTSLGAGELAIAAADQKTVYITISDAYIDANGSDVGGITTSGDGNVVIELDGNNKLYECIAFVRRVIRFERE